jgi:CIC family chloride channel protein
LLAYLGLGLLLGVVSAVFIKAIYGVEDLFEKRIKGSYILRHMGGMLVVGVMMYASLKWLGQYYVEGVGYATVQDILSSNLTCWWLLLLLFGLKLAATSLTLGSGASGGIFSPALFLGATIGGAYGVLLQKVLPGFNVSPAAFAVAGMAGVVGGAIGAAITSIVMIFEMTLDYNVILPMTLTVVISWAIRRAICRESIYTMKLTRRGHVMPDALQANLSQRQQARAIVDRRTQVVSADQPVGDFKRRVSEQPDIEWYIVEEGGRVLGVVSRVAVEDDLDSDTERGTVAELANRDVAFVRPRTNLIELAAVVQEDRAEFVLVVENPEKAPPDRVLGIITRHEIGGRLAQIAEIFADR